MATTLQVGPITRIEGHLEIQVTIDAVNGKQQVIDARCSGTMFRGFEAIMAGRDPRDAVHLTQRICGVCPVSHGMAASLTLEQACRVNAPANGRIMRNLVLGANFIQSHILHFYHLAAPDYINTTGLLDMAPWMPRFVAPDMATGAVAKALVTNYVTALAMRRKAHQMGAIFGGKLPGTPTFVAGGCTDQVTTAKVSAFKALLTELQAFINGTMIPDAQALSKLFPQYLQLGKGCGNLLAYGVFDLDSGGANKLLARGRYTAGSRSSGEDDGGSRSTGGSNNSAYGSVSPSAITEYVKYSYYSPDSGNRNPASGVTVPVVDKTGAYSWLKAPRYQDQVHEVGPLARMWVNGDYRKGISVIDRIAARVMEAKKVADAMVGWLGQLQAGAPAYTAPTLTSSATAIGLTEAPRGALGHWLTIRNGKIGQYQFIPPTTWNASPMDDRGRHGAIEQALIGTPVADQTQPIELLRVIHSFDPCLACSVHMLRPGEKKPLAVLVP